MSSLSSWQMTAGKKLSAITDTPLLEARLLLAFVLGKRQDWLISHGGDPLTAAQLSRLDCLLTDRLEGLPLPYLLGEWPFYGRDFFVSPAVLIPRPETELLVEEALAWLQRHPGQRQAADIGTGSGCIAISLAAEVANLTVAAADISTAALEVATRNILRCGLQERVKPQVSDLLEGIDGSFDLICANLPYIPTAALANLEVSRGEPVLALDGGSNGLYLIERLLRQIPGRLRPDGLALLEIEAGQGQSALQLANEILSTYKTTVLPDLAGHPRLLRVACPAI